MTFYCTFFFDDRMVEHPMSLRVKDRQDVYYGTDYPNLQNKCWTLLVSECLTVESMLLRWPTTNSRSEPQLLNQASFLMTHMPFRLSRQHLPLKLRKHKVTCQPPWAFRISAGIPTLLWACINSSLKTLGALIQRPRNQSLPWESPEQSQGIPTEYHET